MFETKILARTAFTLPLLLSGTLFAGAGPPDEDTDWPSFRGGTAHRGMRRSSTHAPLTAPSLMSEVFVYPNPVRGTDQANIHFSLGDDADVQLQILDAIGRVVAEPPVGSVPGRTEHVVAWSVADQPSGVYLLRLEARGDGGAENTIYKFAVVR
jgi:hypothetical protein